MLIAGIDDLGTGSQLSEGGAYFIINDNLSEQFSLEAMQILGNSALKSFHGKDYKRRFEDKYLDFLKLCRIYVEKSDISLIGVVLQNKEWKEQYRLFCERVIRNVYQQNFIHSVEVTDSSIFLSSPLFTLLHLMCNSTNEENLSILIDSHLRTKTFNSSEVEINSKKFKADEILSIIFKTYQEELFPNTPLLVKNKIEVVDDKSSFIIQAADIFGNFTLSYILFKLGYTSKTIIEKATIFSNVFGDFFDCVDIKDRIKITLNNEFELTYDGQEKLMFGRYEDDFEWK